MDLSIIIPTRGRPDKLTRCIRALAAQELQPDHTHDLTGRFEVIVSIDDEHDHPSEHAARTAWDRASPHVFHVVTGPQGGINTARNRGLERATGRWTLFLNDDGYAQPYLLAAHVQAHIEAISHPSTSRTGAIVVGDAPWCVYNDDSLFDRVVRETSLIFFYDRMTLPAREPANADRWRDWGFRHCHGLNFSAPTSCFHDVGGFLALPVGYGYDDVETAWRLQQRLGLPALYRPGAKVTHDHRYTTDEYLAREHTLGHAAWHLAHAAPECAAAVFGRDVSSDEELDYSRAFVERERAVANRLRESFLDLSRIPSAAITGPASRRLVNLIYEQHLLLKRWEWRRGLLDAACESCGIAATPRRAVAAA